MTAVPLTAAPPTAPATPAPRSKHPTSSSGAESDTAPAAEAVRRAVRPSPSDPLSDRATSVLIRRTLCPQQGGDKNRDAQRPIEEILPPLTSRNDVDLQLYAFLAIILREFVQSWYGKITTDETFVAEIVHIVAHCTRALEQRFRKLDMESLVLDEIPELLDKHIAAYRAAHQPMAHSPIEVDPRQIFHSLCPLPSLSPVPYPDDEASVAEQQRNEAAYRQLLVQAVLTVLLPTEDLENPCLTSLVGQIFSELIIGNVIANKAAQPWVLWEGICILARVMHERRANTAEPLVGRTHAVDAGKKTRSWSVHGLFILIINFGIFFFSSIRLLAGAIAASSSLPPRTSDGDNTKADQSHRKDLEDQQPGLAQGAPTKTPILDYSVWSCAASLMQLPSRMPWLYGFLSLAQHGAINGPGQLGALNSGFDRFLSYHIQSIFSPAHLPPLLRTLRGVLFPNNAPGKPTLIPPSSEEEMLSLRRRAASALWGLLPQTLGRMYLGGRLLSRPATANERDAEEERMVDEVEGLLMVLSDEYCNKHLMYGALELVLVRLMPELSEKGVEELWDERLG